MEVIPGAFLFILQLHPITHKQKTNKPIPLRCSTLTHRSVRAGSVSDGCFDCPFGKLRDFYYRAADVDPLVGRKWKAKKKHSHGLTRNYTEKKKTPVPELAEGARLARIRYPRRLCQLRVCGAPYFWFLIFMDSTLLRECRKVALKPRRGEMR